MASVWITYSWKDNEDQDVDFLAQELRSKGVAVKLDRWNLTAGNRLWDRIAEFITNATESDGWIIYATQNSLGSEPCREELAYALDRALNSRGQTYPIIAIFPGSVESTVLPASLRVRLCLSTTDENWSERIVASLEGREPMIGHGQILPFVAKAHPAVPPFKRVLEFRPRAGVWNPFIFAIPAGEKDKVGAVVLSGPTGRVPALGGVVMDRGEGSTPDGKWYYYLGYDPATPTHSYYSFVREVPTALGFGQEGPGGPFYTFQGVQLG